MNLFFGPNGVGKTSVLEGVYFLSTGRSFVFKDFKRLILNHESECLVRGVLVHSKYGELNIGVSRHFSKGVRVKVNYDVLTSLSDLARFVPVQTFQPASLSLITGAPDFRRKFFNWGLFYDDVNYLPHLKDLAYCIKQRNSVLCKIKSSSDSELSFWDGKIYELGHHIQAMRLAYFKSFRDVFVDLMKKLLPSIKIDVSLFSGWRGEDLLVALKNQFATDFKYKKTSEGPHRFDFKVLIDGRDVAYILSRGELKIVHFCLYIAQMMMFNEVSDDKSLLLFDDVASELDVLNQNNMLELLFDLCGQVFLSNLTSENRYHATNLYNLMNVKDKVEV